jgi:predicted component of type VI protein secretion system
MKTVTFQVLEGIDKGRVYRDLAIPVTIGREEGNLLRLNDERISRYHAKVQFDNEDVILTDLDSTNGTRINGRPVQIRRLLPGDRVSVGRSILVFGNPEEIAARAAQLKSQFKPTAVPQTQTLATGEGEEGDDFDAAAASEEEDRCWSANDSDRPPLPAKLTPSQAARIAEILDFLHRGLTSATEHLQANDDGTQVFIPFAEWQKIQAVHMLLGRYLRAVAEPDALVE